MLYSVYVKILADIYQHMTDFILGKGPKNPDSVELYLRVFNHGTLCIFFLKFFLFINKCVWSKIVTYIYITISNVSSHCSTNRAQHKYIYFNKENIREDGSKKCFIFLQNKPY